MADEILKLDSNNKPVVGAITDDSSQFIKMLRIDDTTKGLKVSVVGGVGLGNVTKVGTPVNNQIGVWTGDGTLEGDAGLTWNSATSILGLLSGSSIKSTGYLDMFTEGDGTALDFYTSDGTTNSSGEGNVYFSTGNASTSGGDALGGIFNISCGNGFGSSGGGRIENYAGNGGATGPGGYVLMQAGSGGATSGNGGGISFIAGNASAGNSNGGWVSFTAGSKTGSGTNGKFSFTPFNGSYLGILDFDSIATSDKTFTFPNTSGTVALTGLLGTKVYYVSDTSGGAVTRKLTFTNGILTSET